MMKIVTEHISLDTRGNTGLKDGSVLIFMTGSTGALTTLEYEPGLVKDLSAALERLAPRELEYAHNLRWGDGNGHSHIRASMLGPGLTVPFADGRLLLGTWQQIIFIDMDNRSRTRKLIVQITGEY
jgi:secondary thiamine-phosphate synthase enzyme